MVFDPAVAPRDRNAFMDWYREVTRWGEGHSYGDPAVTTPALAGWFDAMRAAFPPMNGPLSDPDDVDDPRVSDYSITAHAIYAAFAWSLAEEAHPRMRALAIEHGVGFFDVSANRGEILFPEGGPSGPGGSESRGWLSRVFGRG